MLDTGYMEDDGEELDYDFDTPQKPLLTALKSANKNQGQPRKEAEGAAAKANDDANADADSNKKTKKAHDVDRDVEEELYGDIVSPGGSGGAEGSRGGGAALLTLQVAEVRMRMRGSAREKEKRDGGSIQMPDLEKLSPSPLREKKLFQPTDNYNNDSSSAAS